MMALLKPLRALWLCALLVAANGAEAQQTSGTLTGKETLAGKATDEQRVNNCKVPVKKRGTKARPAKCSPKSDAQISQQE